MWWSRTVPVLLVLGLLSGCGFHPLYGRRDQAGAVGPAAEMAAIRVEMIQDRAGQKLRNELVSRFNPRGEPVAAKYVLTVKLTENMAGLATSQDGTATLAELTVTASFGFVRSGSHVGTAGTAISVVSTDFLGPRYASVAAERDAEDRAITEIADNIAGQVVVYLNNPASRPPPKIVGPQPSVPMQHYQALQGLPAPTVPTGGAAAESPEGGAAPQ